MLWKVDLVFSRVEKHREQPTEVRKVSGDQNVAFFAAQSIADPLRVIVRLKIFRRGELRERVAGVPQGIGCLARAQLTAVPDDGRPDTARGELRGDTLDLRPPARRQGPPRIHVGPDRIAVMNQDEVHFLDAF
jgi:hypothetical protein